MADKGVAMLAAAATETFSCAPAGARNGTSARRKRNDFLNGGNLRVSIGTGRAESVDEELLAADHGASWNADNGQVLAGQAGHDMTLQAEEVRMPAGTASLSGRVGDVANGPVDALHAVQEPGFPEVLQGAEDRHPVKLVQEIDQLTVGERPTGGQERRQDALPGRRGTQTCFFQHAG